MAITDAAAEAATSGASPFRSPRTPTVPARAAEAQRRAVDDALASRAPRTGVSERAAGNPPRVSCDSASSAAARRFLPTVHSSIQHRGRVRDAGSAGRRLLTVRDRRVGERLADCDPLLELWGRTVPASAAAWRASLPHDACATGETETRRDRQRRSGPRDGGPRVRESNDARSGC